MKLRLSRILLLLAGAMLTACQTLPQREASVPSPLSSEEAARITPLPPETPEEASAAEISGAEVFARLQAGFKTPVCTDGERSSLWRKRYAGNPQVFAGHLQQILPMLDFVSKEVQTSGLPTEFALIPLVESWYRPDAMGFGGPAGMWQMIATTAKNHGIRIQSGYDGRLSPVESTRAALSYLKTLHDMFNDWQATVMAYNAGEYRLINAFTRDGNRDVSGEQEKPRGLSNITYDYVAKLQALSCLIAEPQRQGLQLPMDARFRPLAPVLVGDKVHGLDQNAAQTGIDKDALRALNPGYRSGRIVEGVPRLVLIPTRSGLNTALAQPAPDELVASADSPKTVADVTTTASAETIDSPLAAATEPSPAPTNHQVRHGDTLSSIAKRYGLSISALRRINGLGKNAHLKLGQSLKLLP
jgi:membrane-bound lytic murein transglycosylase D